MSRHVTKASREAGYLLFANEVRIGGMGGVVAKRVKNRENRWSFL